MIEIDTLRRALNVRLTDHELEKRLENWSQPKVDISPGFLRLYAERVGLASSGAVLATELCAG